MGGDGDPWSSSVATVVVDGNNVMGAAADGWWRDRPAAVRRLLGRLRCYQATPARARRLVVVLDARQADLPEGEHDGIEVRYPERPGRDAADRRIVALLDEWGRAAGGAAPAAGTGEATHAPARVGIVTSDRALAVAARHRGAAVVGAGTFLDHLRRWGC